MKCQAINMQIFYCINSSHHLSDKKSEHEKNSKFALIKFAV